VRAQALSSAALLKKIIPIYHDYSIFKTPEDILQDALDIYYSREPDSEVDPMDALHGLLGQEAFLLFDEFQNNFRFAEDPTWIAGKNTAVTFHRYSRTCSTFGVIGSSSVDMHPLMFKRGAGESADHWRQRVIPTLTARCMNCGPSLP
jgi:hypothetical protein